MKIEDITESRPVPTHRYFFPGMDHMSADDFNQSAGRKILYPYSGGFFLIRYDKSGTPFFKTVSQLSAIYGRPIVEPY